MKNILTVLFILCGTLLCAAVPQYLVTGPSPSRLEKTAESELQFFWQKIYGRKLQKISEDRSKGKSVIYLGRTAFARANKINFDQFDDEEWQLKTVGDDLIITGGRPAGTLYGVYEVLEKLGVEFLSFDETLIPAPAKKFPVFNEKRKPAFVGRVIYDGLVGILQRTKYKTSQWSTKKVIDDYNYWLLRRRINGATERHIWPLYIGKIYNLSCWPQWHTMSHYVHPDLFDKHPEYFAMDAQGKRHKPRTFTMTGDICMSHPEVRKIALDSLRKMIKKDRAKYGKDEWAVVYDVTRLDNTPHFCQCKNCRAIADFDGSDTGLYVDFANFLAKNIAKEYPDVIIRIQAHDDHGRKLPNKIIPEKNILFRLCDNFSLNDPFRPIEKVNDPKVIKYFKEWTRFGTSHVKMCWDYWNLGGPYFKPPRVESVFDAIAPDMKFYLKHGINALFLEASVDAYKPQNFMMLNYFVAGKLFVDPNCDTEALAKKFMLHYYGKEAYPVLYKYFKLIRKGVAKDPQKPSTSKVADWQYATPEFLFNLYRDFTAASARTKEPRFKQRINSELITPIWSVLIRWHNYEKKFTENGISRKQLVNECRKYVYNHIRRFDCEQPQKGDKMFAEEFKAVEFAPVLPEKFKNIPSYRIRVATFPNFHTEPAVYSSIVKDPDSLQGTAVKSAHIDPACHGINKIMPGKHRFRTTGFYMSSGSNKISLVLKKVPQDEKYHWYKVPGRIVLDTKSNFWGHGWAINARTNFWYSLTYGDPKDNTWEECWFSAKFTGPAYVPGSKKENAIYVDMVVLTR